MYILQLRAEVSSLTNENSHLCRQLDVARSECTVVRARLEEQLEVQTTAARSLRDRVVELEGVRDKWDAEQERVKVRAESPLTFFSHFHSLSISFPPSHPLSLPPILSLSLSSSLPPPIFHHNRSYSTS